MMAYKDDLARIHLKCDPGQAVALRNIFLSVLPGYPGNKIHGNTVLLVGDVPGDGVWR